MVVSFSGDLGLSQHDESYGTGKRSSSVLERSVAPPSHALYLQLSFSKLRVAEQFCTRAVLVKMSAAYSTA